MLTIVDNPTAQPEGTCVVVGVRPGIDGAYKSEGVDHTLSRAAASRQSSI
jgi:hypothetical protein